MRTGRDVWIGAWNSRERPGPLSLLVLVFLLHGVCLALANFGDKEDTPSRGCLFVFSECCLLQSSFWRGAEGAERWPLAWGVCICGSVRVCVCAHACHHSEVAGQRWWGGASRLTSVPPSYWSGSTEGSLFISLWTQDSLSVFPQWGNKSERKWAMSILGCPPLLYQVL